MESSESDKEAARQQLECVLSSTGFVRNERLCRFLRFVVERHLQEKDNELKETLIAVEVFGRKPDFDPKLDAIVRTEALRLRARLSKYYANEGSSDPVIIELPKGGYIPVFRQRESARESSRIPPVRLWLVAELFILVIALAAMGWWWVEQRSSSIRIAVLPLENLSRDPANDYFVDGLTDEIIRNLSVIEGLSVRSRTSSFAQKGKSSNMREVGKRLEVDYVLEGSVLRIGQQLRINAQLIRVRDDFPLWSNKYDRMLMDVFAVQDEISGAIVNNLRLKLGRSRRRYETTVDVYDLYLRARALQIEQGAPGIVRSVPLFEQVIVRDPTFVPAFAELGAAYAIRSIQFPVDHPTDELSKMQSVTEKAIQLDPLLAEAYLALAGC
jgi:TolB-like protein